MKNNNDLYKEVMEEFFKTASHQVEQLEALHQQMLVDFAGAVNYLAEDTTTQGPEEFFGLVLTTVDHSHLVPKDLNFFIDTV